MKNLDVQNCCFTITADKSGFIAVDDIKKSIEALKVLGLIKNDNYNIFANIIIHYEKFNISETIASDMERRLSVFEYLPLRLTRTKNKVYYDSLLITVNVDESFKYEGKKVPYFLNSIEKVKIEF